MSNKNILNEAFFKKPSYTEIVSKKMPQYTPVGKGDNNANNVFAVNDTGEVKKRLAGTFGAAFGDNNIKSMASKALKTFPIIVSDHVEPETVITLKKLLEDQYAEYMNLLISNQVIDLSAYTTDGTDGNIAIQALDTISGNDFNSNRVANKAARTGEVSADDIFGNIPLYNMIRESKEFKTGDPLYDAILENAIVVKSEDTEKVAKYLLENADVLNEYLTEAREEDPYSNGSYKKYGSKYISLNDYLEQNYDTATKNIVSKDKAQDALRGFVGVDNNNKEVYTKLTNTDIIIDPDMLNSSLNRTVGEFLTDPENEAIRDRFEKATFLLQSNRIAGTEYIAYVTMRLGLPMSKESRQAITQKFKMKDVFAWDKRADEDRNINNLFVTKEDIEKIKGNQRIIDSALKSTMNTKLSALLTATAGAVGAGGAAAGVGAILGFSLANPIILAVVLGSAVVGGTATFLLSKLKKKQAKPKYNKIEGWERVESMIEALDRQRADLIKQYTKAYTREVPTVSSNLKSTIAQDVNIDANKAEYIDNVSNLANANDIDMGLMSIRKGLTATLREDVQITIGNDLVIFNKNHFDNFLESFNETYDDCMKDRMFEKMALAEAIETSMPMKTRYITQKPGKDVLIAPEFAARSQVAYGSTEIERKENKDRRYNQPLIMTVKFKERFSDGKFSDNELTAVIGILGKVIRVPSEEMEYILKANAEGETISLGNVSIGKNLVSDLLSTSKIKKDIKNLPQSADIWKNLEKVATLAIANKMAGKKAGVANAHIIFSQKEIDNVRADLGIDYMRDMKLTKELMKRYSAFTLMIANDPGQRVAIYNDIDDISWNIVPYSALAGKDSGDQLASALAKLSRI